MHIASCDIIMTGLFYKTFYSIFHLHYELASRVLGPLLGGKMSCREIQWMFIGDCNH